MRTAALALTTLALLGCQSAPRQPAPGPRTSLGASSQTITTPTRPAPTLEQARLQQASMAAADLNKKTGLVIEPVSGAAPKWWPVDSTAQGLGRGQATSLETAYTTAVRQARGSSSGNPTITKVSYARLPMGDYIVWVQAGAAMTTAAASPTPPTPPVTTAPAPQTATPTPEVAAATQPAAPSTTEPAAEKPVTPKPVATDDPPREPPPKVLPPTPPRDPLAPAWFSTTAREDNGRVYMGASAETATVREAPRVAIEAARAALASAMGRDVPDVQAEATFVTPIENRYRAYVLVSTPGTIRKQ